MEGEEFLFWIEGRSAIPYRKLEPYLRMLQYIFVFFPASMRFCLLVDELVEQWNGCYGSQIGDLVIWIL